MKLPIFLSILLLSASPAVAENALERNPVSLIKTDQRLAQSHDSEIVFVLLYYPGTDQEGIHSLDYGRAAEGILIFESQADASIYSSKLEALNFPAPTVVPEYRHEVKQFIIDNNYMRIFVESGRGGDAPIGKTNKLPKDHNY